MPKFLRGGRDHDTPVIVSLKRADGQLCDVLEAQLEEDARRSYNRFLSVQKDDLPDCVGRRTSEPDETYISETIEQERVPFWAFGPPASLKHVTYARHSGAGVEPLSRTTWVRYERPGLPFLSHMVSKDTIGIQFRPGLSLGEARLVPEPTTAQEGGYVLTDLDRSFGR